MNEDTAVELLKLAVQISADKITTNASGQTNADKVIGEALDVLVKHLGDLKKKIV